jgi:hypothetical protein
MENYRGLIVAIENYHDKESITPVKFALNDAEQFLQSLIDLGCDRDKFEYLYDNTATKTSIVQKLKDVTRNAEKGDTIIFYYAGHGFYHNGKNQLSAVDTFLKSLDTSTIDLLKILSTFEESKSNKIIGFLDCCHSGIRFSDDERSPITDFSTDDLKYKYSSAEHLTIFASCKDDEKSQVDISRKHGVWSYYLIKALSGKAGLIYEENLLFSDRLQSYLADKTFHRVKTITTSKKNQTPVKFGKETTDRFIVADLSKKVVELEAEKSTDELKFESAIISGGEIDFVKNLSGYKSNYQVPKVIDEYHNNWIKKLSDDDIAVELDRVANLLRSKLNYKRKDIRDPLIEDGYGQLVTDEFDYVIGIEQSTDKAGMYELTRTIENFRNSEILSNPNFNEIFSTSFNELKFMFRKINVVKIIDLVELIDDADKIDVKYKSSDTTSCTIFLKDFQGSVRVTENSFSIRTIYAKSPQKLMIECQIIYKAIIAFGFPNLLIDTGKKLK